MNEDIIIMKRKDAERLRVIQKIIDKHLRQDEAGEILGLCERQVRRVVVAVRERGPAGVIHGSWGKPSRRKVAEQVKAKILSLVKERYEDFGPTLAVETMAERREARVSRETLRKWMVEAGLWQVRLRRKKIHRWRERKAHLGEMLQMDGSHHDWLEGRGPKMVLMAYIDDATGRVYGRFYDYEGVFPAMDSFRRYSGLYGLPQSLYIDKHSTYKTSRQPDTEELLRGEQAKTQFERALSELGVYVIHAHSPQAKGRIERSFRTLQDRLGKAMRLAGIKTLEEANEFLKTYWPRYNRRFAKEPRERRNLHRPVPKRLEQEDVFCLKATRTINNGFLIKWRNRSYAVDSPSLGMKGRKAEVLEHFDGRLEFRWQGRMLEVREVGEPAKLDSPKIRAVVAVGRKNKYIPPPDHPWRRYNPRLHHNRFLEQI